MQSQSHEVIAVGHQHTHSSWIRGLQRIYAEGGVKGLWRGVYAQTARNGIGSAAQLPAFAVSKDFVTKAEVQKLQGKECPHSWPQEKPYTALTFACLAIRYWRPFVTSPPLSWMPVKAEPLRMRTNVVYFRVMRRLYRCE